ncbi:MAG: ROK family protein [Gemmatimonadota bacterium]|nr:MAG: ROK family protein [Gemmatimonadota bacterium]
MNPNEAQFLTMGVDIGGTNVETAVVDSRGNIVESQRYPTKPEKGAGGVVEDVVSCVETCLKNVPQETRAVGVGVAGQVERATGAVRFAPNLRWQEVPLGAQLERALNMPVFVLNDVRAATVAEWYHGAGKGIDDLICVFVGTGVGGGIVSGGRLLEGCSNTAGEIGHMTVAVDGRPCRGPNIGCMEAYAGGWAIAERAQEAVQQDEKQGQTILSKAGSIEEITAKVVGEAYHERDPLAIRIIEEAGHYLAAGVVGLVNAINPCLLVLGGGIIDGIPELIQLVERGVRERALRAALEDLRIVKASFVSNAVAIGAATHARNKVMEGTP